MGNPEISHVSVRFNQNGNTIGTTEEYESMTIDLEFQLAEEDGPFVVIKTEGWSFDEVSDIEDLINRVKKVLD